jgi:hypothetical protein
MLKRSGQQASRLKPAPSPLKELINLVNSVPLERKLLTERDIDRMLKEQVADPVRENWEAAYHRVIQNLPDQVREFIGPVDEKPLEEIAERYSSYITARKVLVAIARNNAKPRQFSMPPEAKGIEITVSLTTDAKGRILFSTKELLAALTKVEMSRIRQCPICKRIFWAGRIDQKCCNSQCAHAQRSRRWREQYVDRYKLQRCGKND